MISKQKRGHIKIFQYIFQKRELKRLEMQRHQENACVNIAHQNNVTVSNRKAYNTKLIRNYYCFKYCALKIVSEEV